MLVKITTQSELLLKMFVSILNFVLPITIDKAVSTNNKDHLMNSTSYLPEVNLNDHVEGYKLEQILQLDEINSTFYLLKHQKTSAQHIHIGNKDKENTFAVSFKTIPSDSTGIAHILEHTVLCGSLRFPVKDPFFSMLKRSLSTFMNAFTSSDWTMYPFSTQNKKDYYNLAEVYMDSVFFPKIDELSFKQEGWRLDFKDSIKEDTLIYKGIVYNEMKGVMSSPRQIMIQSLLNALYPDTTYSNNSGGNPAEIPLLTYERLKQFHKKYYHPSNSFFYTYGNLPLRSHLKYINDRFLSHFDCIETSTCVPSQPKWKKPKNLTYYYPLAKSEDPEGKNQVCVAWLTADVKNTFEVLVLTILEQVLLGNDASPLRKALMDSKLGTSLSDGTGFDAENRDTIFACGLKNVKESDSKKIEGIILERLLSLAKEGIDRSIIDSALHRIEFGRREITNDPYPFGIKLLLGISASWFHEGDPSSVLQIDEYLDRIKKHTSEGGFFEGKIKEYFIKNKHKVFLILKPDQSMEENENRRVKEELLNIRLRMNETDLEKIRTDAKSFSNLSQKKENLSCLPTLQLKDVPKHVDTINSPFDMSRDYNIVGYNQPTLGIIYFSGLVGSGSIKKDILPLVPFFCYSFLRLGTTKRDYTKVAQAIDLCTGGMSLSPHSKTLFNSDGICLPFVSINSKCLVRNKRKMVELVQEIVNEVDLNNTERILQLLLEYKSGLESMVLYNGHNLAMSLAARNFSNTNYLSEEWSGVSQLHTIKSIVDKVSQDSISHLKDKMKYISNFIFSADNFKIAVIGEEAILPTLSGSIEGFMKSISLDTGARFKPTEFELGRKNVHEGWITSTSVSFVAQTFGTVRMEHKDSPALSVISEIIRSMYLHREIREKGGAYGAFSIYNIEDGLFSFCSYRDPNILRTLEVYDKVCDFVQSVNLTNEDVKESILRVCSKIGKPDSPSTMAKRAFLRRTVGLNDEVRQNYKTNLLSLDKNKIMKTAKKYFDDKYSSKSTAIVSNEKLLKYSNEKLEGEKLTIKTI